MSEVEKSDLVTVTIDGVQVSVPKDTLVIRAAEQVGVQIPRFCDHPLLAPAGACRQCLVDVPDAGNGRGFPKPQASCTLPVAEGMVVSTQATSPVADKAPPRTSPTTIRSGLIRNACRTRSRIVTSPAPSTSRAVDFTVATAPG